MNQVLVTDHPAWHEQSDGTRRRIMATASGAWLATWASNGLTWSCIEGSEDDKPRTIEVAADQLPLRADSVLAAELRQLGAVLRPANASLWDAITTAILRQVVRAEQARILYRRWCQTHGQPFNTPAGVLHIAPSPEAVLSLPEGAFKAVGAAFHRTALQGAATAFQQRAATWEQHTPPELVAALDDVPRIGPWTASAAAADYTGDFSIYPHGDLAVRTWADHAAPGVAWPTTEKAFTAAWTSQADTARELHAMTLLTLTWGSHATAGQHGGPAPHQ
jgi:DNA-3-methyladenine glycosylase II